MRVVLFGASGMVGGGALRECLEDPRVETVLSVGRSPCGLSHAKLRELIHADLFDLSAVAAELRGYDACFYTVGVTSAGMSEADYRRITYDLTVAVMDVLVRENPGLKVCFVSGAGTDATEKGRVMWARVKGAAENWVLGLGQEAYVFRPGYIQPMKGVRSATAMYQALYTVAAPLYPILRRIFPGSVTTSVAVGQAMINAVTRGSARHVLETRDINDLAVA